MTRVLVLGASRYYLRTIRGLMDRGLSVVAVDRNAAAPGLQAAWRSAVCDIVDVDGVVAVAERHRVDGILPLNDLGVRTAALAAARLGLPGLDPDCIGRVTEKRAMRTAWHEAGIACPRFVHCPTPGGLPAAIAAIGLPCILKPARGIAGGSRGVVAILTPEQIAPMIAEHMVFARDEGHLVEELIQGDGEHSAEVVVGPAGPRVIAIGDKEKTPLPYRVDRAVLYPTRLAGAERAAADRAIEAAVSALGIRFGAAHIEFAMRGGAPVFFELGARAGGGGTPDPIIPYATGIDYMPAVARSHCGVPMGDLTPRRRRGCVYRFLMPPPGRVAAVTGLDRVRRTPDILDADVLVGPGDTVVRVAIGTDRSGFVIAGGPDREAADRLSRWGEDTIRIETSPAA